MEGEPIHTWKHGTRESVGIDDANFVYVQGGEPRLLIYYTPELTSDF